MSNQKPDVSRRKFMLALGAGSAGAVAVAVTRQGGQPSEPQKSADQSRSGAYQVSEHVRNYYRTARV